MKRIILTLLLLLPILTAVNAAVDVEEIPSGLFEEDAENLDPLSQYLVNTIQPLLKRVSLLVGGIFGLYLILILARIHYERKKVKLLKDIRYDLDHLNIHYEIPYSRESNGLLRRLWHKLRKKEPKKKKPKK